jgi:ATP-binding cassette subfamily F protein 3
MRDKLAKKLADPDLYAPERADEAAVWQRKYAEVMEGLERAEGLWMRAMEKLEAAETA